MKDSKFYFYKAKILEVYDGDTVTADVDLGFNIRREMRLRLYGINTPELRGEERARGLEARDWLRERILEKEVDIQTIKDKTGKYGRMLAIIWYQNENINEQLLALGMANEYLI